MKRSVKVTMIVVAALVVMTGSSFAACKMFLPYELTADGETLVVVKDKEVGEKVVKKLISSYVPAKSQLKQVTLDKDLKLQQTKLTDLLSGQDVMTGTEAVEYLTSNNEADEVLFATTIQSEVVEEEKYTPEIEYKQDDTMFAGDSVIETEGEDGLRNVTYRLTSVNGEITGKEAVSAEIVEAGTAKVVRKGTLGLPDGEDWETYEGDPVYKDGEDVVKTAKQHLGSPYKYGGSSFKTGIDCVQYVRKIYKMYGINVPNSHGKIQKFGKGVSLKDAQPGDIICYKKHVAIYAGDGKMAEAVHKGTSVNKVRKGVVTVRRVIKN